MRNVSMYFVYLCLIGVFFSCEQDDTMKEEILLTTEVPGSSNFSEDTQNELSKRRRRYRCKDYSSFNINETYSYGDIVVYNNKLFGYEYLEWIYLGDCF